MPVTDALRAHSRFVKYVGCSASSSPSTNFTNLLWARSTSVTDLVTNMSTALPASDFDVIVTLSSYGKDKYDTIGFSGSMEQHRAIIHYTMAILISLYRGIKAKLRKTARTKRATDLYMVTRGLRNLICESHSKRSNSVIL